MQAEDITENDEYTLQTDITSPEYEEQNRNRHSEPALFRIEKNSKSFDKIYDGSNISIIGFNYLITNFANKHKLAYSAINDLF